MEKNPNPIKDQFFLQDQSVLDTIIEKIGAKPGEAIVEIGGGEGALTDRLIKANNGENFITVIEKDPYYANYLKEKYAGLQNVEVIEGDALNFDFSLFDRVVANLPYTITEPFLVSLATTGVFGSQDKNKTKSNVKSTTLLLSQNSVRKMVAPVQVIDGGSKFRNHEFGIMSAICKSFVDVEVVRAVPSEAFFPMPAVTSILVNLTPKQKLTTVDRIMQNFLVDKKDSRASIGKIYSKILSQSKIYNVNKYKHNQSYVSTSFTSKMIEDKNIYELNNDQLSTLLQDLIANDMKTKSMKNDRKADDFDYDSKKKYTYKDFEDYVDYEAYLEEEEREEQQFMKRGKVKKALSKYDYMYDATAYNGLNHRGLEYMTQEEFNALFTKTETTVVTTSSEETFGRK